MTGAAEEARRHLLTHRAQCLTAYAERVSAHIEAVYDSGAEPTPELVAEFTAACRNAERAWLEVGIANVREPEPET